MLITVLSSGEKRIAPFTLRIPRALSASTISTMISGCPSMYFEPRVGSQPPHTTIEPSRRFFLSLPTSFTSVLKVKSLPRTARAVAEVSDFIVEAGIWAIRELHPAISTQSEILTTLIPSEAARKVESDANLKILSCTPAAKAASEANRNTKLRSNRFIYLKN